MRDASGTRTPCIDMAQFQLMRLLDFRTARVVGKEGELKEVISAIRVAADSVKTAAAVNKTFAVKYYDELVDQRKSMEARLRDLVEENNALQADRRELQQRLGGGRGPSELDLSNFACNVIVSLSSCPACRSNCRSRWR